MVIQLNITENSIFFFLVCQAENKQTNKWWNRTRYITIGRIQVRWTSYFFWGIYQMTKAKNTQNRVILMITFRDHIVFGYFWWIQITLWGIHVDWRHEYLGYIFQGRWSCYSFLKVSRSIYQEQFYMQN